MRIKKLHSVSRMQSDSDLKMLNPTGSSPIQKDIYVSDRIHAHCSFLTTISGLHVRKKQGEKSLKTRFLSEFSTYL